MANTDDVLNLAAILRELNYYSKHLGAAALAEAILDHPNYYQLAQQGAPSAAPVPVTEKPWERPGWCDDKGRCWFCADGYLMSGDWAIYLEWSLRKPAERLPSHTQSLPHYAIPMPPAGQNEVQP